MNDAYFWLLCMPLRYYIATNARGVLLRLFAAVIGVRWLMGLPKSRVGFFGGKAWWKDQRQGHGALWTGYAFTQDARFLKSDVAFGALNWVRKASTSNEPLHAAPSP